MAKKKTIAVFGAGTGLGASLAKRFGSEDHRVALVARSAVSLRARVAELVEQGIEAAAFPADLTDLDAVPVLVRSIEARFGAIDVATYAPVPSDLGFVSATALDAATLRAMTPIFTYAPIEVAHAVLPGMLERGRGAIVLVGGLTAVKAIPGMSGVGPAMAATRNYALTLNAEVASKGVYAGSVSIGAIIRRSAGLRAIEAQGTAPDVELPTIDPDEIADAIWSLVSKRDQAELILPTPPEGY